ncbi:MULTISPECIES: IclR family transcriptional regulator [unclassified Nocardioides]|uniref:IclR family transcriptional regulator n=1 Tax=unclassified Nocardioides TaxID=2615069 RepID=UPI0036062422
MRDATGRERESTQVQSVQRAAALLRAVAVASGPAATATALAEAVGLNRTTTWRLLSTLEQQRLVHLDRETGWYSLGFGLIDLAGQAGDSSLARAARAVLQRIATQTGETAALAVLRDGALTYVAEAVASAIVSVTWRGMAVPLHATSTGKVLLAYSGPDEVTDLLNLPRGGRLHRYTATTITSRARLREELARTRERGFSVCRGEFEESAWGVSAPVLDSAGRAVAVLSIWGPPDRITGQRFDGLGDVAVEGAAELAGR